VTGTQQSILVIVTGYSAFSPYVTDSATGHTGTPNATPILLVIFFQFALFLFSSVIIVCCLLPSRLNKEYFK